MGALQVLVADDEPVSRTVVGAMLKKAGYAVSYAPDGEQAWQLLNGPKPPALALLDWEMPGLQGPEVVERIRGKHAPTPTYVILLTSRDTSADIVARPTRRRRRLRVQAGERRRADRARQRRRARRATAAGARRAGAQSRRSARQRQGPADAVADVRVLQVGPQRPELLGEGRDLLHPALGRLVHAQLLPDLLRSLRAPRARSARDASRALQDRQRREK